MADPISQIFGQARLGSAQGSSLIDPLFQGAKTGLAQQRIAIEKEELAMKILEEPLRLKALELKNQSRQMEMTAQLKSRELGNQLKQIQLTGKTMALQDTAAAAQDLQQLSSLVGQKLKEENPNYDDLIGQVLDFEAKHPFQTTGVPDIMVKAIENSRAKKEQLEIAKLRAKTQKEIATEKAGDTQFNPGEATNFGNGIMGIQSSPGKWRFFRDTISRPSTFAGDIGLIESKLGRKLSVDEFQQFADVHMGVQARASRPSLTVQGKALNDEFRSVTSQIVRLQANTKLKPEEITARIGPLLRRQRELRTQIQSLDQPTQPAPQESTEPESTEPLGSAKRPWTPKTPEEFQAIGKGAYYINPKDGRTYIKK